MNILYVIPDLKKVSGGPRTRIGMFKRIFKENDGIVIEKGNKFLTSIRSRNIDLVYIESATNRISLIDVFCLLILKLYSKKVIVFIRDIYIELFPEEYNTFRSRITLILNKLSNFYLTLISTSMAFPTEAMGEVFFKKNHLYPPRNYFSLPPGTLKGEKKIKRPNFEKRIGILYLGSTQYTNSGFKKFIELSDSFSQQYNFFVLSGDRNLKETLIGKSIVLNKVEHHLIQEFIEKNNIAFAIHTRPRNDYDDLTFPIKVLDFINLQLPFFTDRHLPLVDLIGKDYSLFHDMKDLKGIHKKIQNTSLDEYLELTEFLKKLKLENTYDNRFKKLLHS